MTPANSDITSACDMYLSNILRRHIVQFSKDCTVKMIGCFVNNFRWLLHIEIRLRELKKSFQNKSVFNEQDKGKGRF